MSEETESNPILIVGGGMNGMAAAMAAADAGEKVVVMDRGVRPRSEEFWGDASRLSANGPQRFSEIVADDYPQRHEMLAESRKKFEELNRWIIENHGKKAGFLTAVPAITVGDQNSRILREMVTVAQKNNRELGKDFALLGPDQLKEYGFHPRKNQIGFIELTGENTEGQPYLIDSQKYLQAAATYIRSKGGEVFYEAEAFDYNELFYDYANTTGEARKLENRNPISIKLGKKTYKADRVILATGDMPGFQSNDKEKPIEKVAKDPITEAFRQFSKQGYYQTYPNASFIFEPNDAQAGQPSKPAMFDVLKKEHKRGGYDYIAYPDAAGNLRVSFYARNEHNNGKAAMTKDAALKKYQQQLKSMMKDRFPHYKPEPKQVIVTNFALNASLMPTVDYAPYMAYKNFPGDLALHENAVIAMNCGGTAAKISPALGAEAFKVLKQKDQQLEGPLSIKGNFAILQGREPKPPSFTHEYSIDDKIEEAKKTYLGSVADGLLSQNNLAGKYNDFWKLSEETEIEAKEQGKTNTAMVKQLLKDFNRQAEKNLKLTKKEKEILDFHMNRKLKKQYLVRTNNCLMTFGNFYNDEEIFDNTKDGLAWTISKCLELYDMVTYIDNDFYDNKNGFQLLHYEAYKALSKKIMQYIEKSLKAHGKNGEQAWLLISHNYKNVTQTQDDIINREIPNIRDPKLRAEFEELVVECDGNIGNARKEFFDKMMEDYVVPIAKGFDTVSPSLQVADLISKRNYLTSVYFQLSYRITGAETQHLNSMADLIYSDKGENIGADFREGMPTIITMVYPTLSKRDRDYIDKGFPKILNEIIRNKRDGNPLSQPEVEAKLEKINQILVESGIYEYALDHMRKVQQEILQFHKDNLSQSNIERSVKYHNEGAWMQASKIYFDNSIYDQIKELVAKVKIEEHPMIALASKNKGSIRPSPTTFLR